MLLNQQRLTTVIEQRKGFSSIQLGLVWRYRELLWFLIWRDIKVRYKQTLLGVLWIVIQPLVSMLIFNFLFGRVLNASSGDIPYPIYTFAAILPWNFFAGSLARGSTSVVGSTNLITKVYFPRLLIPVSGVLSGLIDFLLAFLILGGLFFYYRIIPSVQSLLLPVFILFTVLVALGFSLWFSALNVRYRDVNYLVPFLLQIWMYLTPVIYGTSFIQEKYRSLLWLNPLTGIVEGYRWALFGGLTGDYSNPIFLFGLSFTITLIVLISGVLFFRKAERSFADVI